MGLEGCVWELEEEEAERERGKRDRVPILLVFCRNGLGRKQTGL